MKILIYDSECMMCSKFIRFIVFMNRNEDIFITDFKSEWSSNRNLNTEQVNSVLYFNENKLYDKSTAIIKVLSDLNLLFKTIRVLSIIPKCIRDRIYDYVANNRYRVNKYLTCKLPSKKFLNMYLK